MPTGGTVQFSEGRANANHNVRNVLAENDIDSRLLKSSYKEIVMVSEFFFVEGRMQTFFILASDKNRKDHNRICEANLTSRLLPETGRSQSNEP